MLKQFKLALVLFVVLTIITGVIYPLVVTAIAQIAFPYEANGSLMESNGKALGSALIGQPFNDAKYFWSRPSATSPYPYNAASSGGSNLGPTNSALAEQVVARVKALREADSSHTAAVPVDLVTTSASGLDPHISPAAAAFQIPRVAKARGVDPTVLTRLVTQYAEGRQFGFLGEPGVNVLRLNLALDALK